MRALAQSELQQVSGGCSCGQEINWDSAYNSALVGFGGGFALGFAIFTSLTFNILEGAMGGFGLGLIGMIYGFTVGGHSQDESA